MPRRSPEHLFRPLRLSDIELPGNLLLSPLAGWSDAAFRSICLKWGASFTFSEMMSAEALLRENKKTLNLLRTGRREKHFGVQIFGSNASAASAAVKTLSHYSPALIDLNCGCSAPKILKSGAGASLLRNPEKIAGMVRAMKNETDCPVSIKFRSGWDEDTVNYLEIAEAAINAGVSHLCLHPRTRKQFFSGFADWDHIRDLKQHVACPVIGSGDLFQPEDVLRMLTETGCDGAMIARGGLGNPFIFQETISLLTGKEVNHADPGTRLRTALEQLEEAIEQKGEPVACRELRKHFCAYTSGLQNSSVLRREIVAAETQADYKKIVDLYLSEK